MLGSNNRNCQLCLKQTFYQELKREINTKRDLDRELKIH